MSSSLQPGADVVVDLELANFGRFSNSPTCRGGQGAGIPLPATGPPPGGPKSFLEASRKIPGTEVFLQPPPSHPRLRLGPAQSSVTAGSWPSPLGRGSSGIAVCE